MTIVRWHAFREVNAVQERVNRLFVEVYRPADDDVMRRGAWAPGAHFSYLHPTSAVLYVNGL
jgi:hypothetical protein